MTLIRDIPQASSVSVSDLLIMEQQGITKTTPVGLLPYVTQVSADASYAQLAFSAVSASNGAYTAVSKGDTFKIRGDGGNLHTSVSGNAIIIKSTAVGTVTQVDVSAGTTGFTFSGGPITSAGTITLDGVLNLAHGGVGSSTAASARSVLGLGTMATQNLTAIAVSGGTMASVAISGGTISNLATPLALADGGVASSTAASAQTVLGLGSMALQNLTAIAVSGGTMASVAISGGTYNAGTVTNVSVSGGRIVSANLAACSISGGTVQALTTPLLLADGGVSSSTAASARSILGLGTMATQNLTAIAVSGGTMASVAISGGTISGLASPIALVDGGVASSTAASARTVLGLGTMATQNLTAIAVSGGTMASVAISGGTISGLASPIALVDGGVGASTAASARTILGLGTMATQNLTAIAVSGGTMASVAISGGTVANLASPIALADGGTASSTAASARTVLGLGTMATQNLTAIAVSGGTMASVAISGGTVKSLTSPLSVDSGGTGLASVSAGQLFKGNGTGSMTVTGISVGTNNQIAGFGVNVDTTTAGFTTNAKHTGITMLCNSGSSVEVTLDNAQVVGWCMELIQLSSGTVHLSAATGGSLLNRQSFTRTAGVNAAIRLVVIQNATNSAAVYNMAGDATT